MWRTWPKFHVKWMPIFMQYNGRNFSNFIEITKICLFMANKTYFNLSNINRSILVVYCSGCDTFPSIFLRKMLKDRNVSFVFSRNVEYYVFQTTNWDIAFSVLLHTQVKERRRRYFEKYTFLQKNENTLVRYSQEETFPKIWMP